MPENILSSRSNNFVPKIYDRMHQIVRFSYNGLTILFGHLSLFSQKYHWQCMSNENRQKNYCFHTIKNSTKEISFKMFFISLFSVCYYCCCCCCRRCRCWVVNLSSKTICLSTQIMATSHLINQISLIVWRQSQQWRWVRRRNDNID